METTLKKAQLLGIIGSAFGLLLIMPTFGGLLNLVGLLFILLAVRHISIYTKDVRIFRYYLTFFLILIAIASISIVVGSYALQVSPTIVFLLLSVAQPAAVYFYMQSYRRIAKKLNIQWFAITGVVSITLSVLTALISIFLVLFGEFSAFIGIGFLLFRLNFAAIPVLGIVSYALIKSTEFRPLYHP